MKTLNSLLEDYPNAFRNNPFECGDGWYNIILPVVQAISEYNSKFDDVEFHTFPSQVKEKFGCYDEKTEVLTKKGWKFFKDCDLSDDFATLKDGFLIYDKASELQNYKYEGKMYQLKCRGIDLMVTPEHRMFWAKGNSFGVYENSTTKKHDMFISPTNDLFKKPKRFLKSSQWKGCYVNSIIIKGIEYENYTKVTGLRKYKKPDIEILMDDFLSFLGIFISEGCVTKKNSEVCIAACNDGSEKAKQEQIDWERIITSCGFPINKTLVNRSALVYKIYNTSLGTWLNNNIMKYSHNKNVPDFVKDLSSDQISIILKWLYKGDGHKSKTAHTYYTVSKRLSDDVQELILKIGDSFSHNSRKLEPTYIEGRLVKSNNIYHTINWLKETKDFNIEHKTMRGKKYIEQYIDYNGNVYCATVPQGLLYVRRGGKGVWCGNSMRFYLDAYPDEIEKLIEVAEEASATTCEVCGEAGELRRGGWLVTRCESHK